MRKSNKRISNLKADFRKTKLGNTLLKIFFGGLAAFIISFIIIMILTFNIPEDENIYLYYMICSVIGCSAVGITTGLYVGAFKEYMEENK